MVGEEDLNLRRLSQRIYSPPPLPLGTLPHVRTIKFRGRKRPGLAEAVCGEAYVASRLGRQLDSSH